MLAARGIFKAVARRGVHTTRVLASTKPAAADPAAGDNLILNFSLPAASIYRNKPVASVVIPGLAGEYGVTKNHSPVIAELKAGVVQIVHEPGQAPEKYFVSGGFALTHANSVTDIAVVEAAKLDDIDQDEIPKIYAEAMKDFNAAPEGSKERVEAQIEVEVAKSLAGALGVALA
ncbi:atp synthase subunit delta [Nannochloropsis oceanica]